MGITTDTKFGALLCEALGLDPTKVRRLQFDVQPGVFAGAAEVDVSLYLTSEQTEAFADVVRTFAIVLKDGA
jgi:hypothetical protein